MALPKPKTRQETFLAAAAGESVTLPDPVTHKEAFLAKAAGMSVAKLDPVTREEKYLNAITGGGGWTPAVQSALLNLMQHVAYTDDQGQTYYDALVAALGGRTLSSISAVFTQGQAVIYDTDSLDTLKQYLVVTATYSDSTTETVTAYTLSGTLTAGTSTITVSYGGKTTTFNVIVTAGQSYVANGLIHRWDAIDNTASGHESNPVLWEDLVGNVNLTLASGAYLWSSNAFVVNNQGFAVAYSTDLESISTATIELCFKSTGSTATTIATFNPASGTGSRDARRFSVFTDNTIGVKASSSKTYTNTASTIADVRGISASYNDLTATAVYINGSAATQNSASHSFSYDRSYQIDIGGGGSSYKFTGEIYSIRIYNRALTAQEVEDNYAVDVARFGLND